MMWLRSMLRVTLGGAVMRGSLSPPVIAAVGSLYYFEAGSVTVNVVSGQAWSLTVNGQAAASGTGTGSNQVVAFTPTAAMIGTDVPVVLTANGTASTTTDVGQHYLTPKQIAQRLVSPASRYTLFVCGSSRCSANGFEIAFCGGAPHLPIAGLQMLPGGNTATGHVSAAVAKSTGDADSTPSVTVPGVEVAFGNTHVETTFDGNAHSGANTHARRFNNANPNSTTYPRLWTEIAGLSGGSSVRVFRHTGGVSVGAGDGPRYYDLPDGKAAVPCASYTNDSTGSGYAQYSATVPVLGTTGANLEFSCDLNEIIPNGQILTFDGPLIWADRAGATIVNWSAGGSSMDRWAKTTILSDAFFSTYAPLFGPNPTWLLEAWADGYGAAATLAKMQAAIARFRVSDPYAPVIVQTGYPSSTSGASPSWLADVAAACAAIPGVLLLDTYSAVPDYATGLAAGYYGDATHYGPTGRLVFLGAIDSLAVAAAA